ncbi:MAG: hypothetical protein KF861_09310 [Planctomycetaceae bacterium]|nr:hypothetical protein [Planctomycetaceae bacterium]
MSSAAAALAVIMVSAVYALIRYTVFGSVSITQIPMYLTNKSTALSGLILLGWSLNARDVRRRREFGILGLNLIVIHVLLSVGLLSPAYFAKFFQPSGLMTWQAEASLLAGVLSLVVLFWLFLASRSQTKPDRTVQPGSLRVGLGRSVLLLAAAHVALMGYVGWFTPGEWPGCLPPITLLAFVSALIFLVARQSKPV